jgi:hypothetical protein
MGQGGFRLLFVVAAGLVALAFGTSAAASTGCASRLLADWKDGRIDGTYPVPCYRQALAKLPEDLRVYSTAHGDITRALQARLSAQPSRVAMAGGEGGGGGGVSPLLVLLIAGGVVLAAAGSAAAFVR